MKNMLHGRNAFCVRIVYGKEANIPIFSSSSCFAFVGLELIFLQNIVKCRLSVERSMASIVSRRVFLCLVLTSDIRDIIGPSGYQGDLCF